jgi:hypothetical protein
MRFKENSEKPVFTGHDAINLHRNEEYVLRYPIKFGHLNVSHEYPAQNCLSDLMTIITASLEREMKLPK